MSTRRRAVAGLLAACVLSGTVGALPASAAPPPTSTQAAQAATSADDASGRYLVRYAPGADLDTARRVSALGGTVQQTLTAVQTLAVDLPAGAAQSLRSRREVLSVTPNAPVTLQATLRTATTTTTTTTTSGYDPTTDPNSMYTVTSLIGSRQLWTKTNSSPGWTGKGVDIALIDSGVTRVPGLDGAGKVVYGPDLSFESLSADTRNLDTFGHGTHMAGIIAGHDAGVDATMLRPGNPASSAWRRTPGWSA